MLNERLDACLKVRAAILPAKETAEDSFLTLLKLGVTMVEARRASGLPIHTTQAAFDLVTKAISLSGEARSTAIDAHRAFSAELGEIFPGMPRSTITRMIGDTFPFPPGQKALADEDEAAPGLQVVA